MTIRVIREPSVDGATLSVWYVDGTFECFGCEDEIREVAGQPVDAWKVHGKTAIPAGKYHVVITPSQRFKRRLPLLLNVPGFTGIRIHPGNTIEDTEGCLLPGKLRAAQRVGDSRAAFNALFAKIQAAIARGEAVTCVIENPR